MAAYAAMRYGWGKQIATRYLLLGTPLLIFIYRRADLVGVALAALGLALAKRDRQVAGGFTLAAATLVKVWPAVVAPSLLLVRRARAAWAFVLWLAVGLAGWVAIGGTDGIRQVSTFRGASGWELESSVGAVVWAITGERRFEQGANRTGSVPGWARIVMAALLVGLLVLVWIRARRRGDDPFGTPALAAVAGLLVLSPLLSPQYAAWLLPWAAIASFESRRWSVLAFLPVALTGGIVIAWYLDLGLGPGGNQLLLTVRNLSLLAIPVAWFLQRERPA